MLTIFSMIVLILCLFVLLIALNYSVIHWEENKILSLSRKNQKRSFVSSGSISDSDKVTKVHSSKILSSLSTVQNYTDMRKTLNSTLHSFFTKTKTRLLGFSRQVVELSKPVKEVSDEFVEINPQDSPININTKEQTPYTQYSKVGAIKINNEEEKKKKEIIAEEATIGLVLPKENKADEHKSTFEKLETRLYEKLKQSGMSNYDIWLELGDLYHKYDENKKAMEIYALVSKHSKDEHQKQMAINKLIGL